MLALLALAPLLTDPVASSTDPSADYLAGRLFNWDVQTLELPEAPPEFLRVRVTLDGLFDTELVLQRYSVLSQNFRLLEQREDGELYPLPIPEIRTYRGTVAGVPGSVVAASLLENGFYAQIDLMDGSPFRTVEPLSDWTGGLVSNQHLVYNAADLIPDTNYHFAEPLLPQGWQSSGSSSTGSNTNSSAGNGAHNHSGSASGLGTGGSRSSADETCEIAVDADYKYFQKFSSSSAVSNDIQTIVNNMEAIYQRDVGICYDLTTVIVRTSSSQDPYTSNDASTLLNQFRSEWNSNQGNVQRDAAELFTGRNLNGGVIGIAWLGVICSNSLGYSVVQSKYTSSSNYRTSLTAHELGHNWNAGHCSSSCNGSSSCHIMCPCNGGCSGNVTKFGSSSISSISSFKNNRGCLSTGCGGGGGGGTLDLKITPPSPGIAGVLNTVTVTGGTPSGSAVVYYGAKSGSTAVGGCSGLFLGIKSAKIAGTVSLDANGDGAISKNVPSAAANRLFYVQASDSAGCVISNLVPIYFF